MTSIDPMTVLRKVELTEPGTNARLALSKSAGKRYVNKDNLKKVNGMCAWCELVLITDYRRKYCSESCSESSTMNCFPQSPGAKMFVLIYRQNCACVGCGLCFKGEIIRRIRKSVKFHGEEWRPNSINLYSIGYDSGTLHHVDHIIPIHKGGCGSGLDNIQVLCRDCHHKKSGLERRKS